VRFSQGQGNLTKPDIMKKKIIIRNANEKTSYYLFGTSGVHKKRLGKLYKVGT